jgi:fibronectin type 3 domain-containing protein
MKTKNNKRQSSNFLSLLPSREKERMRGNFQSFNLIIFLSVIAFSCAVSEKRDNPLDAEGGFSWDLKVAQSGSGKVTVQWRDPRPGKFTFKVFRAEGSGTDFIKVYETPTPSYLDVSCKVGQTYWYKVSAVKSSGESPPSGVLSVQLQDAVDTTITGKPSDINTSKSASFVFTGVEASSFECKLNGGAFETCVSPKEYAGLADGLQLFMVRGVDQAGNVDPTPADCSWTVDTTPPNTTITASPANPTNSTSATFIFDSSELNYTFKCAIDGGSFYTCFTPVTYTGLAGGAGTSHKFEVKATDKAGNEDPSPASFTWTIDTQAPTGGLLTINGGNSFTNTQAVTLYLYAVDASEMMVSNVATFTGAVWETYTAGLKLWTLTDGVGAKNVYAKFRDAAGNETAAYSSSIIIDTTVPYASIISPPPLVTNSTSATFSFTSNKLPSGFACKLDSSFPAFTPCSSPAVYSGLAGGAGTSHTFEVKAIDQAGNMSTPATYTWTIDTQAPDTTITGNPANPTNSTSATFTFTSTEGSSTFQCQIDGGSYSSCTSPKTYNGLTGGAGTSHIVNVYAVDAGGNSDPSPASYSWTIDTQAPDTTITGNPANPTETSSATFTFTSTEGGSTFECQMDSGGYSGCSSPSNYSGVATGSHTFYVRAKDSSGNVDFTPTSFAWAFAILAPSNLDAFALSTTQINLFWKDNSNVEDGFKIERKLGISGSYSVIVTTGDGVTNYANNGLNPDTVYYYRVYAFNSQGNSIYSNAVNMASVTSAVYISKTGQTTCYNRSFRNECG